MVEVSEQHSSPTTKEASPKRSPQAALPVRNMDQSVITPRNSSINDNISNPDTNNIITPVHGTSRLLYAIATKTSPREHITPPPSLLEQHQKSPIGTLPVSIQSPTSIPTQSIIPSEGTKSPIQINTINKTISPKMNTLSQDSLVSGEERFYSLQSSTASLPDSLNVGTIQLDSTSSLNINELKNTTLKTLQPSQSNENILRLMHQELSDLNTRYDVAIKTNSQLRTVLADYERTMAQIIESRKSGDNNSMEHLKQDKQKLIVDLQTAQIAFQNLHQRYEELKGMAEEFKIQDTSHRTRIAELQAELASAERRYESLRRQAESKLEEAEKEVNAVRESMESELAVMRARLHKSDLRITSLESTIEAKTRENAELMTICDELIGKMDKQ